MNGEFKSVKTLTAVLPVILFGACAAVCQQAQQRLTLEQAVTEAVNQNMGLLAEKANISIAEARIASAKLRPNPVVSAMAPETTRSHSCCPSALAKNDPPLLARRGPPIDRDRDGRAAVTIQVERRAQRGTSLTGLTRNALDGVGGSGSQRPSARGSARRGAHADVATNVAGVGQS